MTHPQQLSRRPCPPTPRRPTGTPRASLVLPCRLASSPFLPAQGLGLGCVPHRTTPTQRGEARRCQWRRTWTHQAQAATGSNAVSAPPVPACGPRTAAADWRNENTRPHAHAHAHAHAHVQASTRNLCGCHDRGEHQRAPQDEADSVADERGVKQGAERYPHPIVSLLVPNAMCSRRRPSKRRAGK